MAASDYTIDIVKYFRRKSANGLEPVTYLGAEQRFVGALPNSNNNNLEEQFLLGTDTYTEMYLDAEGNQVIEKSFKKDGEDINYYKLVTVIYAPENLHNDDFYFDGNTAHILDAGNTITYSSTELDFGDNSFIVFTNDELGILPNTLTTTKVDTLYFIDNNGDSILVAIKTTGKKALSNGKQIIRETVEDKLGLE